MELLNPLAIEITKSYLSSNSELSFEEFYTLFIETYKKFCKLTEEDVN